MKTRIIEQIGQADILLPSLVGEGLAANDRVKVRMSALQAALEHAHDPGRSPASLDAECRAAGLDPVPVNAMVRDARMVATGRIAAPELAAMREAIFAEVATMLGAVEAGAPAEAKAAAERLAALKAQHGDEGVNEMGAAEIGKLIGVSENGADSLHRLIMDLHKALNRLAARCAEEVVAGAHAFGLTTEDRPAVEAFMRGLDSTRALKFDHPGLDTTAMRAGAKLVIQNDIGATDAHVVVTTLEGDTVTVTYTDVHRARARFFTDMFADSGAKWSGLERKKAPGLGDDGTFYLVTGRYQNPSQKARTDFLERVGASLVFLIDWNKARKVLRSWVSNGDSIRILDWAAQNRVGHRGFLQLGGSELVAAAVRHAASARIGFGERLDGALGREAAIDFIKAVLHACTEALLQGRSARAAHDQIEAELVRHLERVDSALLAIVVRQAGLARDVIAAVAHHLGNLQPPQPGDGRLLAMRARRIEEKADKIAIEARGEVARFNADRIIEQLVNRAEEAIDEYEQAAFIASLLRAVEPEMLKPLQELCAVGIAAAEAAASGVDAAAKVSDRRHDDSEDALAAVNRLIDNEHLADRCERAVTMLALSGKFDLVHALSALELARAVERATDRLSSLGHLLREYVLADIAA